MTWKLWRECETKTVLIYNTFVKGHISGTTWLRTNYDMHIFSTLGACISSFT